MFGHPTTRVSSKQSNFFFGSNQNIPKLNVFRLFFGLFRETKNIFFGLFWCFGLVSKQPKQKDILSKQTEKISLKTFSIRGSQKPLIFFLGSNQNKPKLIRFRLFFGLLFRETPKFFSGLFRCFGPYRNNRNKQNLCYGE